jgi:acyl-CoA synthetase (NDP forming)
MSTSRAQGRKLEMLDAVLRPKSIALVGASNTPGKAGFKLLKNLLAAGYEGPVYPINPREDEVLGLKAYRSVLDVPGGIDAAVVAVPAKVCTQVAEECGKKGVKGLIVIAAGFGEAGRQDLEDELVRTARRYGMRVLGPNTVGLLSSADKLNASLCPSLPFPGRIAFVSQCGALLTTVGAATHARRAGFDKMIAIGNTADLDIADCVEWLDADPNTACIALYIEGLKNGRRFIDAARRTRTPIVALKAGVATRGGRLRPPGWEAASAATHTSALAGAARVYEAAFDQAGIVETADLGDLFDRSLALSLQPPLRGDNLFVLTNVDGIGALATDAAEKSGVPLRAAPADLQAELRKSMPESGSAKNPAEFLATAGPAQYYDSVKAILTHPWVDGLVILYGETFLTAPETVAAAIFQGLEDSGVTDKPVTVACTGGQSSTDSIHWLIARGIPAYDTPDRGVNAMAALREFDRKRTLVTEILPMPGEGSPDEAREIIASARAQGRTALTGVEANGVFAAYGLPVAHTRLALHEEAAVQAARTVGYPVAMKVVSPDILDKSRAGAVKVGVKDEEGVRTAYRAILAAAKAHRKNADIRGVAVQEMAPPGTEVVLGSVDDPSFGPTLMFGLGGIFAGALNDVTFRVAPVTSTQAGRMLAEIAAAPLLAGTGGGRPRDRDALIQAIMDYSRMVIDLEDDIAECDANPVLVYEKGKGLKVIDARVILKKI